MEQNATARLRAAGLRITSPRLAVLRVLEEAHSRVEHLPVSVIVERARDELGSLSTQAAYDCLDALTRAGLVRRVGSAGSPARYEVRTVVDHHHLVCRSCGRTLDVGCATSPTAALRPDDDHGFVVDEADVTFWGRCPACIPTDSDQREEPR